MWKMSIQYTVLGFEPTTFRTWVSSHNHKNQGSQYLAPSVPTKVIHAKIQNLMQNLLRMGHRKLKQK